MIVVIPTPFGLFADCKIEAKISVLLLYFIFNALIARIKEIANVDSVPIVSGGIMYSV